jgi:hypothetical protein
MPVNDTLRLGYGGSAQIYSGGDTPQVLITSGSMEQVTTPPYLEMADIPPSAVSRSRVLHADGVMTHTGTISFDMTAAALVMMTTSKFLGRRYQFDVGIHDGEGHWKMSGCYLTNLTLSGAPSGFITASLSFMSKDVEESSSPVANVYLLTDNPMGYWWSGNTNVKEWTLTMNQAVEPVYVNENISAPIPDSPRYLKVGLVDYSLDVTCYQQDYAHNQIFIATTSFILTGISTAKGYSFNGVTDLGMYSHTFVTAANATTGAGALVIA